MTEIDKPRTASRFAYACAGVMVAAATVLVVGLVVLALVGIGQAIIG